jgi:hypothetical protein
MKTHNGEPILEVASSEFETPRFGAEITKAVNRWERRKTEDESWIACFWDGVLRKPSQIRALAII